MDWKKKLQDAKEMLEEGLLDQKEFDQLKAKILSEVSTQPNKVPLPQQIGAYQIFSLIGEGGMGSVYKARHRNKIIAEKQGGDNFSTKKNLPMNC